MTGAETLARAREAAQAFLEPIRDGFWAEHGIDDDEADKGMLAAMLFLGVISQADFDAAHAELKAEEEAERARRNEAEAQRRAALTPEAREREDRYRAIIQDTMRAQSRYMAEAIFRSPSVFAKLDPGD